MVKLFWFQCYDLGSSAVMHPFFVAQARRSDAFAKCVGSEDTGQPNPAVLEPLRAFLTGSALRGVSDQITTHGPRSYHGRSGSRTVVLTHCLSLQIHVP